MEGRIGGQTRENCGGKTGAWVRRSFTRAPNLGIGIYTGSIYISSDVRVTGKCKKFEQLTGQRYLRYNLFSLEQRVRRLFREFRLFRE